MPRVALATATRARQRDEDMPLLVDALAALGIPADPVVWDAPETDWTAYALVVVRSTWDYSARRDAFLAWTERPHRLLNRPEVLRWNTDKRYLRDFADQGVPIVPTRWLAPGDPIDIPCEGDVVVKPSVGAGAIDAARHATRSQAEAHVRRLQDEGRTAMVQPYLRHIDEAGETALIFIDGAYSHAIRKAPILRDANIIDGLFAQESIRAATPTPQQRDAAERAVERAPKGLLYARVDLAPSPDGPLLLEFEAAEPSLFLACADKAATRFAKAIAARI